MHKKIRVVDKVPPTTGWLNDCHKVSRLLLTLTMPLCRQPSVKWNSNKLTLLIMVSMCYCYQVYHVIDPI